MKQATMDSRTMLLILACTVAYSLNNCEAVFTDKVFNVLRYGAAANGKIDSAHAISSAWNEACATDCGRYGGVAVRCRVVIPEGNFLAGPVSFRGPCRSPMVVQVKGVIRAPTDLSVFQHTEWIAFRHVTNLLVTGLGTFDGQGRAIWPYKHGRTLPPALKFIHVVNAKIRAISLVDPMFFHMIIGQSQHINILGINITAPGNSPNTDGIHVGDSSDIRISASRISTGDDCISLGPGTSNVTINKVECGTGHGISVGSLGKNKEDKGVDGIRVLNCTFTGTTNGVRIKTWRDSPPIKATNIVFSDLVMNEVSNPIVIDQEYCPHECDEDKPDSRVKIDNVLFQNIRGTSATDVAISLVCSSIAPCDHITLDNIDLQPLPPSPGLLPTVPLTACAHVGIAKAVGVVFPPPCF